MANAYVNVDSGTFHDRGNVRFTGFFNWLGAILTVSIVSAVGFWGYQLMARDVSQVPVVRAVNGPMRVVPENPGGVQAEHQGLAVNLVATGKGVGAPADRLVLAPDPVVLTDEDLPKPQLDPEGLAVQTEPTDDGGAERPNLSGGAAVLTINQKPADTGESSPVPDLLSDDPVQVEDVSRTEDRGLEGSPLPRPRPERDQTAQMIAMAVARSLGEQSVEVKSSAIAAGMPLAQFGTYDSPETARAEWGRLTGRFPDFLRGRNWFVEETVSGGRSYYRLRTTGFDSVNDSERFCSLFKAKEQNCVAVVMR